MLRAQHRTRANTVLRQGLLQSASCQRYNLDRYMHVVWQLWLVGKLPHGSRVQHEQRTCQRHDGAQMLWLRAAWDSRRVAAPSAIDKPRRTHLRFGGGRRVPSSKHTVCLGQQANCGCGAASQHCLHPRADQRTAANNPHLLAARVHAAVQFILAAEARAAWVLFRLCNTFVASCVVRQHQPSVTRDVGFAAGHHNRAVRLLRATACTNTARSRRVACAACSAP